MAYTESHCYQVRCSADLAGSVSKVGEAGHHRYGKGGREG